jgi:hypothetical protein
LRILGKDRVGRHTTQVSCWDPIFMPAVVTVQKDDLIHPLAPLASKPQHLTIYQLACPRIITIIITTVNTSTSTSTSTSTILPLCEQSLANPHCRISTGEWERQGPNMRERDPRRTRQSSLHRIGPPPAFPTSSRKAPAPATASDWRGKKGSVASIFVRQLDLQT